MLRHQRIAANARGRIGQLHGEAQRPVVQYLVTLVTIRQHQAVAQHQRRRAATHCGAHAIAVHAVAMVQMERGVQVDVPVFAPVLGVGPSRHVALIVLVIPLGHVEFLGILGPHVYAEAAFARSLQGGPIDAIGPAVVFPAYVVLAQGVHPPAHPAAHRLRCARGHGVDGAPVRFHGGVDEQPPVVGNLPGHLLPHRVAHHKRLALGQSQPPAQTVEAYLYEFLPLEVQRIDSRHRHLGGTARSRQHGQPQGKKQGSHHLFALRWSTNHAVIWRNRWLRVLPPWMPWLRLV